MGAMQAGREPQPGGGKEKTAVALPGDTTASQNTQHSNPSRCLSALLVQAIRGARFACSVVYWSLRHRSVRLGTWIAAYEGAE
jgi:hypothetical protein